MAAHTNALPVFRWRPKARVVCSTRAAACHTTVVLGHCLTHSIGADAGMPRPVDASRDRAVHIILSVAL